MEIKREKKKKTTKENKEGREKKRELHSIFSGGREQNLLSLHKKQSQLGRERLKAVFPPQL